MAVRHEGAGDSGYSDEEGRWVERAHILQVAAETVLLPTQGLVEVWKHQYVSVEGFFARFDVVVVVPNHVGELLLAQLLDDKGGIVGVANQVLGASERAQ